MTCTVFQNIKVPEFGEHYAICNCGQHVKSLRIQRLMTIRVDGGGKHNEVNLSLPRRSKMKKFKIHELMGHTFFCGYDPSKHKIVHKDKDTTNNNIQNLTLEPINKPIIDCDLYPLTHPEYPELAKNYKICRCGKHICSIRSGNILKQHKTPKGYIDIGLYINDDENKLFFVHKLVAHTFLRYPNDGQTYVVDHINCDRSDNRLENLRFATYSENNKNVSTARKTKPIVQYNLQGEKLNEFDGISVIIKENPKYSSAGICICLRNDIMKSTAYGFRWQYKNEEDKNIKYEPKEGEVFKDIADIDYYNTSSQSFEKLNFPKYQISNYGTVISKRTRYPIGYDDGMHLSTSLMDGKKNRVFKVHVLVASVFVGPPSEKYHIIKFKDGNNKNVHADNLEWTTMKENMTEIMGIPIVAIDPNGNETELRSIKQGAEFLSEKLQTPNTNYESSIRSCLNGYQESAYGYKWRKQSKE